MSVRNIDRSLERREINAKDVHRRMVQAPTPRERERWRAVRLLAQGWTALAAAKALERDPHTIGPFDKLRRASLFGEGGAAALIFEQPVVTPLWTKHNKRN